MNTTQAIDLEDTDDLIAADRDGLLRQLRRPARRCVPSPPRRTRANWTYCVATNVHAR